MTTARARKLLLGYYQRTRRGRKQMYAALQLLKLTAPEAHALLRDAHLYGRPFDFKDEVNALTKLGKCIETLSTNEAS